MGACRKKFDLAQSGEVTAGKCEDYFILEIYLFYSSAIMNL
jgi:hypothetical protein